MQCFSIVLAQETKVKIDERSNSLFYGITMHGLDQEYVQQIHQTQLAEFHIKMTYSSETIHFDIWGLTEIASHHLKEFFDSSNDRLYLKQKNIHLPIIEKKHTDFQSYYSWYRQLITEVVPDYLLIEFASATSFKQKGKYQPKLDLELIYQNVLRRINSLQDTITLDVEVSRLVRLSKINLKKITATKAFVKSVEIPSFKGEILLELKDASEDIQVIYLLWKLAERYGVGIKTAMGMGQVKVTELYTQTGEFRDNK